MSNTYFPLHVHSHYSLLDGLSTAKHITDRLTQIGLPGTAITEHGNLSSCVQMLKACKESKHKLILGVEFYLCEHDAKIQNENNRKLQHIVLLAKNDNGWKNLLRATYLAGSPENFYYKPRLSLEQLRPFSQDLIGISGHWGSNISNAILDANGGISPNAVSDGTQLALLLKDIFGDNFYLECQLVDQASKPLVDVIREISLQTGIKCVATPDAHYAKPEQYIDQHVLLATNLRKTIFECTNPDFGMSGFFKCHNYYIPSYDEMIAFGNTEEELANTLEVANKCEEYKTILRSPQLPEFKCPDGYTPDMWLLKLCKDGWDKKILSKGLDLDVYNTRLERELNVLQGAGLSSYFLIVRDILDYVCSNGWLPGPGRGCFLPDTRVKMSDGTYTPISLIKIGNVIIDAYGQEQKVYNILEYDIEEEIIELEFENSKIIRCTKDHKFLTKNKGWIEAQLLTEDDDIIEV